MKLLISKSIQVILDLLVGLAIYYFFTTIFPINENLGMILTLVCTAIFAEFYEVKIKK